VVIVRTDGVNLLLAGGWIGPGIPIVLAAVLVIAALMRLYRGRRHAALLTLAAAGGPVCLLPVLLATHRRRRGVWQLAAVLAVIIVLGVGAWVLAPDRRTAAAVATTWWVIVATGVFYTTAMEHLSLRQFAVLVALRLAAIAAVAGLLLKPALSFAPPEPRSRPPLTVLVDRSSSMATMDHEGAPDRYAQAIGAIRGQHERLGRRFELRWSHFAVQAESVDSLNALAALAPSGPDADATDLAAAIGWAARSAEKGSPVAMLVLSDGIQTGAGDARGAAAAAGVPIYTVAFGSARQRQRNLRITRIEAPVEAIIDNRCTVTAHVEAGGMSDQVVEVQLGANGRPLATWRQIPTGGVEAAALSFVPSADNAPADGDGSVRRLRLRVVPVAGEVTGADNEAEIHIWLADPRIGVLYVESIRPEYKFLSAQLRRDPNIDLVTMLHLSADKFVVHGQVDGRQPSGLPIDEEQWDLFDVVILGDVDAAVWRPGQLQHLTQFVHRGGGLVMLGGARSFGLDGYGETPLAGVLPVRCGRETDRVDPAPFVPRLTADGTVNPVTSFLAGFLPGPEGRPPDAALPELAGFVQTAGVKGSAVALAVHPSGGHVILATGRVGEGRSMAFTPFAAWRWHLQLAGRGHDSPYGRFWRQAVRYLSATETDTDGLAPQVLARADRPHADVGESVALTAHTRRFEPAAVAVEVVLASAPDIVVATVPLAAIGDGGQFSSTYEPTAGGAYILRFIASDAAGAPVAADELPLAVLTRGGELDRIARDDLLLADIARRSGGRSGDLAALTDLIDHLSARAERPDVPHAATVVPLHSLPIGLTAMISLLTLEWILRRRWQLR